MDVIINVNKMRVYDEVAKTTSYIGAKMPDAESYDHMFTTDEDRLMLERFWTEAASGATEQLKPFVSSVAPQQVSQRIDIESDYTVRLNISGRFNTAMQESMETSLFSYFVNFVISRWCRLTYAEAEAAYMADAAGALSDVMRKLYFKKKPTRP
ncbi:MAG: hypothetical protein IJ764_00385 [Bacteroidales bacterium]|nr:hypothetical protein [Bacteroidales bacterium]